MRAELLTTIEELKQIESAWQDLADTAREPNPFFEPFYFLSAMEHLNPELRVVVVWDRDELIGFCPVQKEGRYYWLPLRSYSTWQHDFCFNGTPLLRRGKEELAACHILQELLVWEARFVQLGWSASNPVIVEAFQRAARAQGFEYRRSGAHDRAILSAPSQFPSYYRSCVRKKRRKEHQRLLRRLSDLGEVDVRHHADWRAIQHRLPAFLDLERSGWKGQRGTALGSSSSSQLFIQAVMERGGQRSILSELLLDGHPIAMQLSFRSGSSVSSFKIAYNEEFARYSPGVLLTIEFSHYLASLPDLEWADSCADPNHPMINGLWRSRQRMLVMRVSDGDRLTTSVLHFLDSIRRIIHRLRRLHVAAQN